MSLIPCMPGSAPADDLSAALGEAGCLVVTDLLEPATRERIRGELDPHLREGDALLDHDDPEAFYPGHTRRTTALVARSTSARDLVVHPTTQALCDRHLLPSCERYQLHVTAALEVGPGARSQILHREEDPFEIFPLPRPTLIVATMWAISDFRIDNGGTQLVPGSHLWPADRKPEPHEIVQAEMPAGSVLYWLGGTLHGAGANTSQDWRYGVILTYSLGWLRQEENQFLDVPAHVAEELSPELLDMTGRAMHGALGFFDGRLQKPGGPA